MEKHKDPIHKYTAVQNNTIRLTHTHTHTIYIYIVGVAI